jgi:2-keto-4-pentenoate hydratase/2-oxohepta-3-ene-1,7-dioic acid hydratase in catechol pathway
MKLVTFEQDGTTRIGALRTQDGRQMVVDLNRVQPRLPADMNQFLEGGAATQAQAEEVLATVQAADELDVASVGLKSPIPRPGKIICVGLNYKDHAAEANLDIPEYPTIFSKYANTVIGPGQPIVIPKVTQQVDYEGELAFVIGQRARYVAQEEGLAYVAGYLPFNDVSARDFQMRTSQWTIGKTFDTFAPMGPALVTADEIPDPHNLDIRVTIGNEVLQASNTRHLIFSIPQLVAYLSQVMTLEPGDVVSTGTPSGVGFARKPPRFLRPGDVVQVEIEGLGTLANPVVAEA